jgi:hypothetical protein
MSVVFLDFGNICTYEGTFTGEKFWLN